ncbi:MAG: zinc ribbon domain-containing protein [Coriobacteriales bacterium]|jgi:hypothetical protein|nr:zinc ribbon domain-containing protein [Coriobacteriales bacterium]
MYCEKCGNQLLDNARFCDVCGQSVGAMASSTFDGQAPAEQTPASAVDGYQVTTTQQALGQMTADASARPLGTNTNPEVITQEGSGKQGVNRCPSCSSSDVSLNIKTGMLRCEFCRTEWSEATDDLDFDIGSLQGVIIGSGAADIDANFDDVITLKCSGCGAEVVIDTSDAQQARCHWCRNMLSINQQIPNGAVPDAILPFKLTKQQAEEYIAKFVNKRRFFAHPKFTAEFNPSNVMGVYLPYMVIDINAHASFSGQGEHLVRRYTVRNNDKQTTYYDADLYNIGRDFDLHIDDLTIEASSDKLNQTTSANSNNVINAILPYPLKETLRFNANYLKGFSSEKRDVNREHVSKLTEAQARDIARYQAKNMTGFYDRGVRWDSTNVDMKGQLWKTVYLPVWLYSYMQVKSDGKKFLHYVATNAVTGETMGSVPIHMPKLLGVSAIVEIVGCAIGILLAFILLLVN